MRLTESFVVSENHLKLLNNFWVGYNDDCEFGAPEIDPKRPYGNSDVYNDIAEIIGMKPEADEDSWGDREFTDGQKDKMYSLHKSMQTVLQILIDNASSGIKEGSYKRERYGGKWARS